MSSSTSGCGERRYDLSLQLQDEDLRGQIAAVELSLVSACDAMDTTGVTPPAPLQTLTFRTHEPPPQLAPASPGRYGLYARGRDAGCVVIAAGCSEVSLEAGGSGALVVRMSRVDGPGCDANERCDSGLCATDADADADAEADADADAEADAEFDADGDAELDEDSDVDSLPLLHYGGHTHSPGVTEADLFVDAAEGDDGNDGSSLEDAVATIDRALSLAEEGATIAVLDGVYYDVVIHVDGVTLSNLAGESPTVSSRGEEPQPTGIHIAADGVTVQGFEVQGCSYRGVSVYRASDVVVRYVTAHHNGQSGISSFEAIRPVIEDCVAYLNYAPETQGAEGAGIAMRFGTEGGTIRRSVSFNNSSDGFDAWEAVDLTLEDCLSFGNGVDRWDDGAFAGEGAGFSLGASQRTTLRRCVAHDNAEQGIDLAGGDEATIEWCSLHQNLGAGIEIPSGSDSAEIVNTLAYGNDEAVNGTPTRAEHNSWEGFAVSGDDFLSLTPPTEADYQRDGFAALEASDYLHLTPGSDLRGAASDGSDLGAFQSER